ncbi:MAG: hypothetical protein FWC73_08065 [Defluviitaleaceae bacterium]|nr:hypothetical protein [Defluviitaleaceae bacterium]
MKLRYILAIIVIAVGLYFFIPVVINIVEGGSIRDNLSDLFAGIGLIVMGLSGSKKRKQPDETEPIHDPVPLPPTTRLGQIAHLISNEDDGPGCYISDSIRGQIIESYRFMDSVDGFYMFEDIPFDKLEAARLSYAQELGGDETIIILYDDTVKKSGKDGFILTNKRLYSKNFAFDSQTVHIRNIRQLTVPKFGLISSHIIVSADTRGDIELHVTKSRNPAEIVYFVLDKTINLLKAS